MYILHQVQSNILDYLNYWCCTAEMELRIENLITKVVITMVTKRPCIPVAHINGFSAMPACPLAKRAVRELVLRICSSTTKSMRISSARKRAHLRRARPSAKFAVRELF